VSVESKPCAENLAKRALGHSSGCVRTTNVLTTGAPYFIFVSVIFALIIGYFHCSVEFNEGDLYRVLMGLLNGQASGLWLQDPTQYGIRFGYGYVAMIYGLGQAHIFDISHRESLIEAINAIGFLASVATVGLLMASLRVMYDVPTALLASTIFISSPLFLEMATCGHQLLIALAFFFAANFLLVLDVPGRWIVVSYGVATALLFVGLTMRAELPLAFSWLAFAQRPRTMLTQRQYILGVISRSIVCVIAFAFFQIVFRYEVHTPLVDGDNLSGLSSFLGQFYKLDNVIRGGVILVVGCGLATVIACAASLIVERTRIVRHVRWPEAILSSPNWLGPVSLILIGTMFWVPNPYPARHFTFVYLGIAVLIASWVTRRLHVNNPGALAIGLAVFLANQALAEVARPFVLHNLHSVYVNFPEHSPTTGVVPLGSFPRHRASLVERAAVLTNFAAMVTGSCEPKVLILTSNGPLMAGVMFKPNSNTRISSGKIGYFLAIKAVRNNQTFLFVDPQEIWPKDPVAVIVNNTDLDEYQILRDPYSMSANDKLAVPAGRTADYPHSESAIRCDGEIEEAD
jgi:hypothetical protein